MKLHPRKAAQVLVQVTSSALFVRVVKHADGLASAMKTSVFTQLSQRNWNPAESKL